MSSTAGSSQPAFGDTLQNEFRLKWEADQLAYKVAKEKDQTLMRSGSLDADEDIRVDEVSSAIDCVIHIGESNKVRSKKSRGAAKGERRALCYVQDNERRKKKKMEVEIQRRL
nr:hypothetical protein [Tanacetum cinerariifolium]